jgi:two-component system cell cycle sensor histidine kinase PleC
MGNADAWGAAGRRPFAESRDEQPKIKGNAEALAAPAYKRLLAAEPYLRRSIPTLIVIFLLVVAATRALSLMAQRDDLDRDVRSMLALTAANIRNALTVELANEPEVYDKERAAVDAVAQTTGLGRHIRSFGHRRQFQG